MMHISLAAIISDYKERQRQSAAMIAAIEQYTEERMNDENTDGSRSGGQPVVATEKAYAMVREVLAEWGIEPRSTTPTQLMIATTEALCRAIEQQEDLRQPTQADTDAMESILWVDTIIDDKEAIAKAFARHRQHGYDQGYYDGCTHPFGQIAALRKALQAAPLIGRTESVYDFMERQNAWLKGPYRAALERSK